MQEFFPPKGKKYLTPDQIIEAGKLLGNHQPFVVHPDDPLAKEAIERHRGVLVVVCDKVFGSGENTGVTYIRTYSQLDQQEEQ